MSSPGHEATSFISGFLGFGGKIWEGGGGGGGRSIPLELKRKVDGLVGDFSPDGNKITSLLALERPAFPFFFSRGLMRRVIFEIDVGEGRGMIVMPMERYQGVFLPSFSFFFLSEHVGSLVAICGWILEDLNIVSSFFRVFLGERKGGENIFGFGNEKIR